MIECWGVFSRTVGVVTIVGVLLAVPVARDGMGLGTSSLSCNSGGRGVGNLSSSSGSLSKSSLSIFASGLRNQHLELCNSSFIAFMVCFRISDPSSLYSAVNDWCPEIRTIYGLDVPIVLIGCQSDSRSDRDILWSLGRQGFSPVSADQGVSLSRQSGCVSYAETSAKFSSQSVIQAFEVAVMAALGVRSLQSPPPVPPKPVMSKLPDLPPGLPPKPPRRAVSTMALNHSTYSTFSSSTDTSTCSSSSTGVGGWPKRRFDSDYEVGLPLLSGPPLGHSLQPHQPGFMSQQNLNISVAQPSMPAPSLNGHQVMSTSRATLFEGRGSGLKGGGGTCSKSMLSLLRHTPKATRKGQKVDKAAEEQTVTIKCQRLNTESKEFEEVDIEVPAPIYETLRFYNENPSMESSPIKGRNQRKGDNVRQNSSPSTSLASKIKSLFFGT